MDELPIFELDKLIIRGFENKDIDLVEKAAQDPLIPLITTVPANFSKEAGMKYIKRQKTRHKTGVGYAFVIDDIKANVAVGSIFVGLNNIENGRASIGYWILKEFRGNKIIKRSLPTVINWVFEILEIPRVELYVEPLNVNSIKVAQSLGFQNEGLMRSWQKIGSERKDMFMLSLLATD